MSGNYIMTKNEFNIFTGDDFELFISVHGISTPIAFRLLDV